MLAVLKIFTDSGKMHLFYSVSASVIEIIKNLVLRFRQNHFNPITLFSVIALNTAKIAQSV